MSNLSGRHPLLVSFTFGRLSKQLKTTGEKQQPRNIGEELYALSPGSKSLKKLGGGGDGNVYVTVDTTDGEDVGCNKTELVAATNLDSFAHFSVVITLPEVIC